MRISHAVSDGSALMRLMSAAPRARRGEQPLERDDVRPLPRDDVERLQRLGVGERQCRRQIVALLQDLEMFGRGDENRRGHSTSV